MSNRSESSNSERAFHISNLDTDSPQIKLAHNFNSLQTEISKSDNSAGFIMDGSNRISKILSRGNDGSVKEQTVSSY